MATKETALSAFETASHIQNEIDTIFEVLRPPAEGKHPKSYLVIDYYLVKGTRGYIERTADQINGAYENGWYDACAVMLRKFIETLIIEAFEAFNLSAEIQDTNGDYLTLKDLVGKTLSEPSWNLARNSKKALPKLKNIGDQSAHSRRFNANRHDIEHLLDDIRTVTQELIYLAKFK